MSIGIVRRKAAVFLLRLAFQDNAVGSREKLNRAYVNGALIGGALLGAVVQSWVVFAVASVLGIGLSYLFGDIRPRKRRP